MNYNKRKIGPLDVYEVRGETNGSAIVLFHGFGANALDLLPLSGALSAPAGTNWFFPDGIIEFDVGPNMIGRAWWQIDQQALEYALARGTHRDLAGHAPTGLPAAREAAREFLAALDFPPDRITLGGFSQGAMLATELTLRAPVNPAGLVILSGNLLDEANWRELAKARRGLQFFQSHGTDDPLLSYQGARNLEAILRESGLSGEFVAFNGGHEIPARVVARLGQYLTR